MAKKRGRPPKNPVTRDKLRDKPESEDSGLQFAKLVRELLDQGNAQPCNAEQHKWIIEDLARYADISTGHLKKWTSGQDIETVIPKGDVYRICWALCGLFDGSLIGKPEQRLGGRLPGDDRRSTEGRAQLGTMLNRLLRAAGYRPLEGRTGYDTNVVWEQLSGVSENLIEDGIPDTTDQEPEPFTVLANGTMFSSRSGKAVLQERVLTVGYFVSRPLLSPPDPARPESRPPREGFELAPDGLAAELTHRLGSYLGVEIRWRRLQHWDELLGAIKSRSIDLLAPRMKTPRRLFGMDYSRGLPYLRCGVNALIAKECLGYVLTGEHVTFDELPDRLPILSNRSLESDQLNRLRFVYTPGNIGEYGYRLFRPPYSTAPLDVQVKTSQAVQDPGCDWVDIVSTPWADHGTRRIARCYVTGQLLCYDALTSGHKLAAHLECLLPLYRSLAPMEYAFGISSTEDLLLDNVNICLDQIFDDHDYTSKLYERHRFELEAAGVYLPATNSPRPLGSPGGYQ